MLKKIVVVAVGIFIGFFSGLLILKNLPYFTPKSEKTIDRIYTSLGVKKHQVIGFLPYWLLAKADKDYGKYLTTLTYFGLIISPDGTIRKFIKPTEEEPGWYSLRTGKVNKFLNDAKNNDVQLSLLVFNADEEEIGQLLENPQEHAKNLIEEVAPIMKKYGFVDLNLDIESVREASDEARRKFTLLTKEIKRNMDQDNLGTLTVDASPIVLVKDYLINLNEVGKIADYIVLMTYDYHYSGSFVTGPVAPIGGAVTEAEFDSEVAIKEALRTMPAEKILLGVPLYGYEWETLSETPRSAVIPGSGLSVSNRRVEEFIKSCENCKSRLDEQAKEPYLTYLDKKYGTYHQIFYPDVNATAEKIQFANRYQIGGLALWALGYEGDTILNPIESYK